MFGSGKYVNANSSFYKIEREREDQAHRRRLAEIKRGKAKGLKTQPLGHDSPPLKNHKSSRKSFPTSINSLLKSKRGYHKTDSKTWEDEFCDGDEENDENVRGNSNLPRSESINTALVTKEKSKMATKTRGGVDDVDFLDDMQERKGKKHLPVFSAKRRQSFEKLSASDNLLGNTSNIGSMESSKKQREWTEGEVILGLHHI